MYCDNINIPKTITHLTLDCNYPNAFVKIDNNKCVVNQKNNYYIHNFLKRQDLDNLEYLEFPNNYNDSIKGIIPKKLKTLDFGSEFNYFFEKDDLPKTLRSLTLGIKYSHSLINVPKSLIKLELVSANENVFNSIPRKLKILVIYANNIKVDKCEQIMNNLPIGLEKLIINCYTEEKKGLLKKIPFGCIVYNERKEILCD